MPDNRRKKYSAGDSAPCRKCGSAFVLSEKNVKKGNYVCPACRVVQAMDYARRNPEKRRIWRKAHDQRMSPERQTEKARSYRARHPEQYEAHKAVAIAIRQGLLTRQPCSECGKAKSHAHHEDYSTPLIVEWLCHACHMMRHGRYIKAQPCS